MTTTKTSTTKTATTSRASRAHRVKVGDTVRVYGYRGTFVVTAADRFVSKDKIAYLHVEAVGFKPKCDFGVPDANVVEINGERVAMLSLPIQPPSSDYPHGKTLLDPSDEERAAYPGFFELVARRGDFEVVER